jgi:glycosyltransferase involved in cell wall biosynthesis
VRSHQSISALFVNSGILGHKSVFNLIKETVDCDNRIDATHINLSDELTASDRLVRRLLCFQLLRGTRFVEHNLDLARWRQEFHAGLLAARRIRAAERLGKPFDVLHFHTQATAYLSLRRMIRTPAIVSIDCTQRLASLEAASGFTPLTYRPNVIHDRAVFRAARAIISISEWAAKDLRESYPDCADKVMVLPYPVKLKTFDPEWIEERHSGHRTSTTHVRVLFMGGDFKRKGGKDLLDAWREGRFDEQAELDVVTDWPIPDRNLPRGIRLIRGIKPFTAEWRELWRRAEVFVMPTRSEAFGMVYQEAGAAGLPAIGTRINAVPEIIDDGTTGILISPGNKAELVSALRNLIGNADLRRRFGHAARRRAESLYSPEKYSQVLTTLITQLAQTDGRHASIHPAFVASAEGCKS